MVMNGIIKGGIRDVWPITATGMAYVAPRDLLKSDIGNMEVGLDMEHLLAKKPRVLYDWERGVVVVIIMADAGRAKALARRGLVDLWGPGDFWYERYKGLASIWRVLTIYKERG